MNIIRTPEDMQRAALALRREGKSIGVVPTMGYLHEGHLSLIRRARERADVVITTLFVNPLQFGPNEDFEAYPRDFDRDVGLAEAEGTDLLFAPEPEDMFSADATVQVVESSVTRAHEESHRPGHFTGVLTIVMKLFQLTLPDIAVFGQKDAQQLAAVRRMVRDLNVPVDIVAGPIVREPDGLAMSSRNVYLSDAERSQAVWLSRALDQAVHQVELGERHVNAVISGIRNLLAEKTQGVIDYVAVVDPDSFEPLEAIEQAARVVLTVRFGATRLLDNALLEPPTEPGGRSPSES